MALIRCEDCGHEVSDRAPSCPKCGAPIATRMEAQAAGAQLVTTQETSKKFKVHTLLSVTMIIIGGVVLWGNATDPDVSPGAGSSMAATLLLLVGLVWYIVNRFRIWWHHK